MIALWVAAAQAHVPQIWVAGPDDDWCAVIDGARGDDIVMLEPGVYTGPCDLVAKLGNPPDPGELTIVESIDPTDPATFVAGDADYVLRIDGVAMMLLQLAFADLPDGVDAVRVGDIEHGWVRYCWFDDVAGVAVRQVGVSPRVWVTDSEFHRVGVATDLGCDGGCPVDDLQIVENLVVDGGVGHHIGAGSSALVSDEVVYGVTTGVVLDGGGGTTIDGVIVRATEVGVDIADGPAQISASVVSGAPSIAADGVDDVVVTGSTLGGAPSLTGWGAGRGLALTGSAVWGELPDLGGADVDGTVACDEACFVDPAADDWYPSPGSPLLGAGAAGGPDWCGRPRGEPPTAGAFEAYPAGEVGPLGPRFKEDYDCRAPAAPEPEPEPEPELSSPPPAAEPGCGCATGASGSWVWLAAVFRTRRRR